MGDRETRVPHPKTMIQATSFGRPDQTTHALNNQQKEERRQHIPLLQTSLVVDLLRRTPIHKHINVNTIDTSKNPPTPPITKTYSLHHILKKAPTDELISLFKVHFKDEAFLPRLPHRLIISLSATTESTS